MIYFLLILIYYKSIIWIAELCLLISYLYMEFTLDRALRIPILLLLLGIRFYFQNKKSPLPINCLKQLWNIILIVSIISFISKLIIIILQFQTIIIYI